MRGDDRFLSGLRRSHFGQPSSRISDRARVYRPSSDCVRCCQFLEAIMNEEQNLRNPDTHGRRDTDTIGVEFDAFVERTEKRLRRIFIGALIALSIMGLSTTASLVGFGIVLHEQSKANGRLQAQADQIERLAIANAKLAQANTEQAAEIQQQRKDSIRDECVKTNNRHDGAVNALIKGSDIDQKNASSEEARAEIRRRRDVTIDLLDAMAPRQNCDQLVADSVKPTGG